jgi:hypothetical protein
MIMVCDAPASWIMGLLAEAQGRHDEAKGLLRDALERTRGMGHVSILPRLKLDLGRVLARSGNAREVENARGVLAEARAEAERLGYRTLAKSAAELGEKLGDSRSAVARDQALEPSHPAPALPTSAFRLALEGEYYSVAYGTYVVRLKASLGLRLLERLVSNPDREFHVLELVSPTGEGVDGGDSGELLDERAVGEYRRRLEELREAAREAEAFGDSERRSKAEAEIDALGEELARAVGLGGRWRRAGAVAERARINVQRRLRDAIRRIGDPLPELGRFLSWSIKTGVFCVYAPDRRA